MSKATELAELLLANGKDCECFAWSCGECTCDAVWGEQYRTPAAALLREQAAEIDTLRAENERLKAKVADWKDRWYKVCDVSNGFRNELEELKRTGEVK